jgi:hypothetical protein
MNRDSAYGAALAGALLLALPFLDLLLGGDTAAIVRAVVGSCGLGLLALSAALRGGKEAA